MFKLVLSTIKYALRMTILLYIYSFLSCYIFAFFKILCRCPPKIIDACLPITTKIWECLEQMSFFKSMSSSCQYFFKSKLLSQASLRNVFPSLHMSHFDDHNHIFLKLVSALFHFFY